MCAVEVDGKSHQNFPGGACGFMASDEGVTLSSSLGETVAFPGTTGLFPLGRRWACRAAVIHLNHIKKGLPCWHSGLESACWASLMAQWLRIHCQCRGHRFEPCSGRIPHAAEQLSPCTTTTEPAL